MSTNTGPPIATKITLMYEEDDDSWTAREENRGVTVRAATRDAALQALDEAIADRDSVDRSSREIDPEDPFFSAPTYSSGRTDVSRNVDDHLAEATSRDKLGTNDKPDR